MVFFSLFSNIIILVKMRSHVRYRKIWILIVYSVAAAPLGAYLLFLVEQNTLRIVVGCLIILFAVALWRGYNVKIKNEKLAFIPVGLASGLLNGSLSLMGPPVVLFLTNQGEDKRSFVANITAFAFVVNIVTIASYGVSGHVDKELLTYLLWLSPALVLGTLAGIQTGKFVKQEAFKKVTLLLIIVSGLSAVISAVYSGS
jgi:hypothetical protein